MRFTFGLILLFALASCSLIEREVGYPGGNLGYLADRNTLFAKGQEQRVNRYLVSLALIAPLVAETARTGTEAKLSSSAIELLYGNIAKLKAAASLCKFPTKPVSGDPKPDEVTIDCTANTVKDNANTALNFESLSFEVANSLGDALKQAFDNLEIKANVKRIIALDPSEILRAVLGARRLIPILMDYLATFRDVTIVFGQSVVSSCSNNVIPACSPVTKSFVNLINRPADESLEQVTAQRPIHDIYSTSKAAIAAGLDWKLEQWQVVALLQNVNRACRKLEAIAKVDDENYTGCSVVWDDVLVRGAAPNAEVTVKAVDTAKNTLQTVNALIAAHGN
ncbi:hypothetical protein [Pseudophaeobacter sp. EL27]|uniref:hypothetical protein n=1 Tax=Pseudophaeobacter sp. EL27 TaxID=2107580 RepID=UPI000EFC7A9D|nr:hypothetical protein [Pseudophaeobacter sp. EL27]